MRIREGYLFFKKRYPSLTPSQRKFALRACSLKSCTRCAIRCGVHGFAMNPYVSLHISTAPYYREARVTFARRQTACRMRHCCARRIVGTGGRRKLGCTSTRWAERQRIVGVGQIVSQLQTRQRRVMGSAIGKHCSSSSCSLAMRIPFSWGSKGDILFPWKENIPLNRPPARCRENPALSGGLIHCAISARK